jgi:hypothetical protein
MPIRPGIFHPLAIRDRRKSSAAPLSADDRPPIGPWCPFGVSRPASSHPSRAVEVGEKGLLLVSIRSSSQATALHVERCASGRAGRAACAAGEAAAGVRTDTAVRRYQEAGQWEVGAAAAIGADRIRVGFDAKHERRVRHLAVVADLPTAKRGRTSDRTAEDRRAGGIRKRRAVKTCAVMAPEIEAGRRPHDRRRPMARHIRHDRRTKPSAKKPPGPSYVKQPQRVTRYKPLTVWVEMLKKG